MEKNEYLKLADVEDRMWYFEVLHEHVHRLLAKAAAGTATFAFLDAGCGTGGLLKRLRYQEPRWKSEGVDLSPLACELARRRVDVPITEGSVTKLPFADETFDAIVSVDVLYQLERPAEALVEMVRCLRPGGTIVVTGPAYRWLWSYHDKAVQGRHRFTLGELAGLLRNAGLEPCFSSYWNTLLFPLIVLRRKLLPAPAGGSDVALAPRPVEAFLRTLMRIEGFWIHRIFRMPFGCCVLVAGVKR